MSATLSRVSVNQLARHFGRRKALAGISFDLTPGEIVGLLGPNGAGKSTLLAILATLLQPSAGTVTYGEDVGATPGAWVRSQIGLLGHDLFLYPELTAQENLTFFARLHGVTDAEALVAERLHLANLTDRAGDPFHGFSRGMRQRLALERALVHSPRLLLLDEPFTGLDQHSAAALIDRLQGLRDRGCMLLVATHDLEVVDGVLSRALYLRGGRLAHIDGGNHLRSTYHRVMMA